MLKALLKIEPTKIGDIYVVYEAEIGNKTERTIGNWLRDKFSQYNLVRKDATSNPTEFEFTQRAGRVGLVPELVGIVLDHLTECL
ncbi:hypothetical protein ACFQO4_19190 [Saliphagus sp. GCM10025334]